MSHRTGVRCCDVCIDLEKNLIESASVVFCGVFGIIKLHLDSNYYNITDLASQIYKLSFTVLFKKNHPL